MTRPISPTYTDYAMVGGFSPISHDPDAPLNQDDDNAYLETGHKINGRQIANRSIINKTATIALTVAQVRALFTTPVVIIPHSSREGYQVLVKYWSARTGEGTAYTVPTNSNLALYGDEDLGYAATVIGGANFLDLPGPVETFAQGLPAATPPTPGNYFPVESDIDLRMLTADVSVGTMPLYVTVNYDLIPGDFGA